MLSVRHEIEAAVLKATRSRERLRLFEGGMLDRAETALKVAERAYQAGAVSLLELLEAQRTNLEVRGEYLETTFQYRQAAIDITHAVGGNG